MESIYHGELGNTGMAPKWGCAPPRKKSQKLILGQFYAKISLWKQLPDERLRYTGTGDRGVESIYHGELGNNYLTRDSGTGVWSLSIMVNLETTT